MSQDSVKLVMIELYVSLWIPIMVHECYQSREQPDGVMGKVPSPWENLRFYFDKYEEIKLWKYQIYSQTLWLLTNVPMNHMWAASKANNSKF